MAIISTLPVCIFPEALGGGRTMVNGLLLDFMCGRLSGLKYPDFSQS